MDSFLSIDITLMFSGGVDEWLKGNERDARYRLSNFESFSRFRSHRKTDWRRREKSETSQLFSLLIGAHELGHR